MHTDASYEEVVLNAQCRATNDVKDEADIGLAFKYAQILKIPIAVRGGGHSAGGASSSEDRDLPRYLNQVRVDPKRTIGYIDGGRYGRRLPLILSYRRRPSSGG